MPEPHVGDEGTELIFTFKDGSTDAAVDISAASTLKATFRRPDGSRFTVDLEPVSDGVDGRARYSTQAGDLSVAGSWRAQGYVVNANGKWWSDIVSFAVAPNL